MQKIRILNDNAGRISYWVGNDFRSIYCCGEVTEIKDLSVTSNAGVFGIFVGSIMVAKIVTNNYSVEYFIEESTCKK